MKKKKTEGAKHISGKSGQGCFFVYRVDLEACMGFPSSSAGKESTCNAGDPGLIPGLWRSPEERIGYPLQYSWASLVAQMVKNLPTMWETWVWSLGQEDPLEEGMATYISILAWRIPMDRGYSPWGSQRVRHDWVTQHSTAQKPALIRWLFEQRSEGYRKHCRYPRTPGKRNSKYKDHGGKKKDFFL